MHDFSPSAMAFGVSARHNSILRPNVAPERADHFSRPAVALDAGQVSQLAAYSSERIRIGVLFDRHPFATSTAVALPTRVSAPVRRRVG